jgi:Arc/MetJ-type ribon-helix-helix transcriptional regulator
MTQALHDEMMEALHGSRYANKSQLIRKLIERWIDEQKTVHRIPTLRG